MKSLIALVAGVMALTTAAQRMVAATEKTHRQANAAIWATAPATSTATEPQRRVMAGNRR